MKRLPFVLFLCCCLMPFERVSAERGKVDIAVLIAGMSNPYWKTLHQGVSDTASEMGLSVYVQGAHTDQDAEQQLNICNTMLLRKPRALVFAAISNVNLAPCLRKANASGITLIGVDGGMGEEDAQRMGIDLKFSVASNNYELGKKAAEYLQKVNGKVLLIEGSAGSVPGLLRAQGFKENLHPGLELVASLPGNWDRLRAADIANSTYSKHPDLKAIFAANDIMALGASEALLSRNVSSVKVIGVDGIADAVKAIQAGRLTASIAQLPYLMGKLALEKAHRHIDQQEQFAFDQSVPILILDRTVLKDKQDPLLDYVR